MISEVLFYYGSALIPLCYLLATRFLGRRRLAILIALGFQILSALGVEALVYHSWRAGDREWFWTRIHNVPINVIFMVIYLVLLSRKVKHRRSSASPSEPQ